MATTRRSFLAASAATAAAASLGGPLARRALARPDSTISVKPSLVVLFLRGGQDALNAVVPHTEGRYYDLRPNIAVPPPGEPGGALDLDGTLGFHPALSGFKALYDEGALAPVVCTGMHHPSRSHFDCQDWLEYGSPGDRSIHQGWLNRYLQATTVGEATPDEELRALAMQGRLPRSLRGDHPVLAVPPTLGFRRPRRGEEDVLELFEPIYPGSGDMPASGADGMMEREEETDDLAESGRMTIETMRRLEEILATAPAGDEVTYAADGLSQQLRRTARVLKSGQGVQIVGLDWNGWDHHINQGRPEEGQLYHRMLSTLDHAVSTFFADLASMRSKVVMLIMTEFGRTNAENGNLGTDHGHGSAMFVIGGKVQGGRVHGEWTTLAPGRTFQNRDLEVTTDFRAVMQDVLYDHLELHPSRALFPGFDPQTRRGLFRAASDD